MEGYGTQENVLRWIAKWLEDRKQRVQLNGHILSWAIFIDDIDEEVLREISKFADNTKIASSVNTLDDIRSMQRTLDKLLV